MKQEAGNDAGQVPHEGDSRHDELADKEGHDGAQVEPQKWQTRYLVGGEANVVEKWDGTGRLLPLHGGDHHPGKEHGGIAD
mmetsp:Transcript_4373/g.9186  ORF Transcript_4373/g.9186 Transcript_4373/m.9186 type:complete len:81 (-) Transcript_4373:313-555(-)